MQHENVTDYFLLFMVFLVMGTALALGKVKAREKKSMGWGGKVKGMGAVNWPSGHLGWLVGF